MKYTKEILEEAARTATSVTGVMRNLGLSPTGGNHAHISKRLKSFDVDTSHFGGKLQGLRAGNNKKAANEILIVKDRLDKRARAHQLRRALVEVGVEYKCSECGQLPVWNNKPLTLQVDHKNGKFWDNRLENLRFLCSNCHSQTETFGSKNQRV